MVEQNRTVSRRALARGVGWGVPTIAAVSAAPMVSASPGCLQEYRVEVQVQPAGDQNLTTGYQSVTQQFTVPAGVTIVTFEIAGGGGGVNHNDDSTTDQPGGHGHLIKGNLNVTPGTVLTLTAGNGGIGLVYPVPSAYRNVLIPGGQGYGNGGSITTANVSGAYGAGSGGGGSVIRVGTTPIVVAGGGGAGGGGLVNGFTALQDAKGGDAGFVAQGGGALITQRSGNIYTANGGGGANGATQGAVSSTGGSGTHRSGLAGGANTTNGGNGANGVQTDVVQSNASYVGGAGGGGYAGGASANVVWNDPAGGNYMASGGGGGGGSSYVRTAGAGVTVAPGYQGSSAGNGRQQPLTRAPGWIILTFFACGWTPP